MADDVAYEISAYIDPTGCPEQPPVRARLAETTRSLHDRIDARARQEGEPVLSDAGQSVTFDLFATRNIVRWQEQKAENVFSDERSWFEQRPIYARYGLHALQAYGEALGKLYGAPPALATCSGMTAVATVFESLIEPGMHVVLVGQAYNKSKALLERMTHRLGGSLSVVATNDGPALERAVTERTGLVFAETFTNPHVRALDLATTREALKKAPNAVLVVDDTIATPWGPSQTLLGDPGADIIVGSGTKALAGNDTALSGYIVSRRADLLNACMNTLAMRGGLLDAQTAEALRVGLALADTRHALRTASAEKVAAFLETHPKVGRVYHPSLAHHPDHEVAMRHYVRRGSLVSFRLLDEEESVAKLVCDALAMTCVFRYALSFDGLVSKVNHHRSVSEYFTPEEVCRAQDMHGLIRIGIGVEDTVDLIGCLNWALWHGAKVSENDRAAWENARRRELSLLPGDPS